MGKSKKSSLEILCEIWDRQKERPFPVGILEVVSARLFYVGIVLRQRPHQTRARVGIAADRLYHFCGPNAVRAKAAYERFALELRGLGGTSRPVEGMKLEKGVEWRTLHADITFEGIRYQDVNRRSRVVANEAKEIEKQQAAEAEAELKRQKESRRRKPKIETEKPSPVLVTLSCPRLVRSRAS